MNVTNETNDKGAVLCVVCGKPATWRLAGGVRYTSPMRRVRVRNIDALVHECCLQALYDDIARQLKRYFFWRSVKENLAGAYRLTKATCRLVGWMASHPWATAKILAQKVRV